MRCLTCHYSLQNLPANRCPECGRKFDPVDPRTFEAGRGCQRFLMMLLVNVPFLVICMGVGVAIGVFDPETHWSSRLAFVVIAGAIGGGSMILVMKRLYWVTPKR